MSATTADRFLDGKIVVAQFPHGFRAGLDAVMLAAAVPAEAGDDILELGAGAGTAALCLAKRVDGAKVTGVEIDPALADLANANAAANDMAARVRFVAGDALALPADLKRGFSHVLCNPPFHGPDGAAAPDAAKARALQDGGSLPEWLAAGVKRTASGGTFTAIVRADRLGEALAALPATGITVFALWPRAGEAAKRAILQVRVGSRAALRLSYGLVLHGEDGAYTPKADAVLRGAASLALDSRPL